MQETNKYRHELKYKINYGDYLSLRQRLKVFMQSDEHSDNNGRYVIRSIYFDNIDDKALREKVYGFPKREKFRIRYYNDDFSFITLEKKIKYNNLCMKFSAQITEEECRAILSGDTGFMKLHTSQLVRELFFKMKSQQLRPRVLVSYIREPFVFSAGNVRVTFDSDIRTTLFHGSFLEKDLRDISALDNAADIILEVKYDEFIPDIILHLIQTENIRQQAYSKYGACRRFG